jgi:HAD superfamily hydrolase (TIGR01509 family)
MINTIIFDMDGVIVDSELHWREVEEPFLRKLIPHDYQEYHKYIVGRSLFDIFSYLDYNFDLPMKREEFMDTYNEMAKKVYNEWSHLIPGVEDLIELLRKEDFTLGLASSSPMFWVNMAVERFDLGKYFNKVMSADQTDCKGKPAPDIYIYAVEQLGKEPSECLAIEDSKNGLISAQKAGLKCVGLRNGFNDDQDLSSSDIMIHGFEELSLDVIRRL